MILEDLIEFMSKLVLTINDYEEKNLKTALKICSFPFPKNALPELIYLKAYIAGLLTFGAGGRSGEAEYIIGNVFSIVENELEKHGATIYWGASKSEFKETIDYYSMIFIKEKFSFPILGNAFARRLDATGTLTTIISKDYEHQFVLEGFVRNTYNDLSNRLIDFQKKEAPGLLDKLIRKFF